MRGAITRGYHASMKLSSLKALVAAVDEGSLRAAARRLAVSQPALTKMIRELERELGTTLVIRSTTGIVPTAQGKVLYDRACTVDRELVQAVDQIRQLDGQMTGELKIGAVPLAVLLLIPETLRSFNQEFPGIRLCVSEELYLAQLTRLRKGEVDVAVGPVPDGLPQGEITAETLMPISMVVVVRKGNPLAKVRHLHELADAPWVYTGAAVESGYARLLFERHGLAPPPTGAVVNSTLGLLALITGGDFVGLMPWQIAMHPLAQQYMCPVPVREGPLQLTIGAMVRAETSVAPAVRHFVNHLHRAASQLARAG